MIPVTSLQRYARVSALLMGLAGCGADQDSAAPLSVTDPAGPAPVAVAASLDPRRDHHSYANPADFRTRHLSLDLRVDFESQRLTGSVTLELERQRAAAEHLVLDSRDLDIESVEAAARNEAFAATAYSVGDRDAILGSPISIRVPPKADRLRIHYSTRPEASGLQWLEPAQTASGAPFLFTHAQAVHARSFIPLQDTPQVRLTYDAVIRTDPSLVAVMAAEFDPNAPRTGEFRFRMPQAIPSYLIALAVGRLEFKALGPRTGVWAEPSVLGAAAKEFADTETMITQAEALYGPYRWGRYDLLVLPASFAWGGMENPRLTFISPTVIAGDRSLVAVVAHEIAHAWSGNLATNATWRDTWLNEGFTVYVENRIMEAVYGEPRAQMEQTLGLADLHDELAGFKPEERFLGALTPDLRGRDPDLVFSKVVYEKGALFLRQFEYRYGRERFDAFLQDWFGARAFTSVTTEDLITALETRLLNAEPGKADLAFVRAWIEGTDIPSEAVLPASPVMARVDAMRAAWEGDKNLESLAKAAANWTVAEWIHFIDGLPRDLATDRLQALDARYRLTDSTNAEIAHSWFKLAIAAGYGPADAALERYLTTIGRRKLILPLYQALAETPDGLARAQRLYAQARPFYQGVARGSIEAALNAAAPPP